MRRKVLEMKQIGMGELILVNRDFPLKIETDPEKEWKEVPSNGETVFLSRQAAVMFKRLLKEADPKGELAAVSGYRSRREQRKLYEESLKENGELFTNKYVALPGCSEHETGLAVDVGPSRGIPDKIRPEFPGEGAGMRFRQKAAAYGFVVRYEAGKERITRIGEEPWHFRYVGYPHSCVMEEKALCLEEYHEFLRKTTDRDNPLEFLCQKYRILVWYEEWKGHGMEVNLEEGFACQLSGDNRKGFFMTQWRGIL